MDKKTNREQIYKHLGERIYQIRVRKGITTSEIASKLGKARTTITLIEQGKSRVMVHDLLTICDVLNIDIREILP